MKPDWMMLMLWLLLGLCSVAVIGLLVLPALGWIAATVAWLAMAVLVGILVRALFRAANFTH